MHLNFEKKLIVVVVVFCAIIILIGVAIIWPVTIYINNLNRDTYELRVYMEKRYENARNIRYTKQKTAEIKDEVQNFPQLSFKASDQLALITTLENVASQNKISQQIENLNLDPKTKFLTLSLSTTGEYNNSWRYLADLEKINYFLQIDKLSFSPIYNRTEQSSSTKMLLNLKLYVNE